MDQCLPSAALRPTRGARRSRRGSSTGSRRRSSCRRRNPSPTAPRRTPARARPICSNVSMGFGTMRTLDASGATFVSFFFNEGRNLLLFPKPEGGSWIYGPSCSSCSAAAGGCAERGHRAGAAEVPRRDTETVEKYPYR